MKKDIKKIETIKVKSEENLYKKAKEIFNNGFTDIIPCDCPLEFEIGYILENKNGDGFYVTYKTKTFKNTIVDENIELDMFIEKAREGGWTRCDKPSELKFGIIKIQNDTRIMYFCRMNKFYEDKKNKKEIIDILDKYLSDNFDERINKIKNIIGK